MSTETVHIDQLTRQIINDIAIGAADRILADCPNEDARVCAMFTESIIRHGRNRKSAIRFADAVRMELVSKHGHARRATETEAEMKERAYAFITNRGLWADFAKEAYGHAPEAQD